MKYNIEVERTWPMPVKIILLTVEADTMRQAHGFARTKAYKVDEFKTPEPEEIAIRGIELVEPKPKQGNLFKE